MAFEVRLDSSSATSSWGQSTQQDPRSTAALNLRPEQVVFVARRAVRAAQAADQQHGHAYGDQHGDQAAIRIEPMDEVVHILR